MNNFLIEAGHILKMLKWAAVLHLRRWSRYRADVALWIGSIWLTILAQGLFVFSAYQATGGDFFGYSLKDVVAFFGMTLFSTGLAQIVVHGFPVKLASVVWKGDFDFWLLHPVNFFVRVFLEEIGIVWFWPHVIIGSVLMGWALPFELWGLAIVAGIAAAAIEIGIVISICMPAIKWGRWDPSEGLWEYLERSRSIPVGRTKNTWLLIVSFGVLQYSLALEVLTGRMSIFLLIAIALSCLTAAWLIASYFIRTYTSASS